MFLEELTALIRFYEEEDPLANDDDIVESLASAIILFSRRKNVSPVYALEFLKRLVFLDKIHRHRFVETSDGEKVYVVDWPGGTPEV